VEYSARAFTRRRALCVLDNWQTRAVSVKWATFIVAAVALAQVWVIELWRRFFRRGNLDIHETGLIEVGYSAFGPTIALQGTLRAVHHDQFVQRIHLALLRHRDGAQHFFEWEGFRSGSASGQIGMETPASFLVSTSQPHRLNVFFSDLDTRTDVQAAVQRTREAWQARLVEAQPADDDEREALYADFQQENVHTQTYGELRQLSYWTEGGYSLALLVETSRPERTFERRWTFALTRENADSLLLNAVPILLVTCGFATGTTFNFANVRYEDAEEAA
jgi:hypothetical protein